MLCNVSEILNYQLTARDGEIGKCRDFLFDDDQWTIRYMVADTRQWLPGRKVLISPLSLAPPQWQERLLPVDLDKDQIKNSPPLDEDAPVSRQFEMRWFDYYRFPYYWPQDSLWGINHYLNARKTIKKENIEDPQESHLRSVMEVKGYAVVALDGNIGHLEDVIIDDTTWAIRYLVIDTRDWLPGRKVLISPLWVGSIYWAGKKINVSKNRETIEKSPEYDPRKPVNLIHEMRLYDYNGRPDA